MSRVRKLIATACVFTALAALSFTSASAVLVGTVTASNLNVRSQPSTSAHIIDTVPYGTVFDVKSYADDWITIYFGDQIAYVSADYCAVSDVPPGSVVQPWEKEDNSTKKTAGEITGSVVNFRAGPSTSAAVIGKFYSGTLVNILEPGDSWYKVEYNGTVGYVSADYIALYDGSSRGESSSSTGQQVIAYAERFLGTPYVYGGSSPSGFDCSGFVKYITDHFGYNLSRTATAQYNQLSKVSKSNLKVGDLVFFSGPGSSKITHVGIYAGANRFIHSPSPGKCVRYDRLDSSYYTRYYYGAARYL